MTKVKKYTVIVNKLANGIPEVLVYGYIEDVMAAEFAKQMKALDGQPVINIRINSRGGSVYEGIAMFNCMRNTKSQVHVYVDGIAASMASVIALAGHKVYMSKYARLMTHKPSGGGWGSSEELRNIADQIDGCHETIADIMSKRLGITKDQVNAKYLNGKDNFFTAQAALTEGLIDDIYDGVEVEVPEDADVEAAFNMYQTTLEASLNNSLNQSSDMRQIPLAMWGQLCAVMGITDASDDATVLASFKKMADKAKNHDTIDAKLKKAEQDLADLKKAGVEKEVKAILDKAESDKKVTPQLRATLEKDYAENPSGLQALVANMTAFSSITEAISNAQKGDPSKVKGLKDKTWKELDKIDGALENLKANDPDTYYAKYEEHFKKRHKSDTRS